MSFCVYSSTPGAALILMFVVSNTKAWTNKKAKVCNFCFFEDYLCFVCFVELRRIGFALLVDLV